MSQKISKVFHGITSITPADGNIFADLGFPAEAAERLLAETDKAIFRRIANAESTSVTEALGSDITKPVRSD